MNSLYKWTIVVCIAGGPVACFASERDALAKRLHNAANPSSLDDPALKPWHLKLDIQLYDAKGNPSEQGTIEEWWTAAQDKRVYMTPSYNAAEIRDGGSVYRTKGQPTVPYLLNAAREIVVHPVATAEVIDKSDLKLQARSFGKVKLDCVMLSKQGASYFSEGQVPTFCLDTGIDQLRVFWLEPEVSTRNSIGLFQERRFGVDSSISIYGAKAVSQHVEILDSKAFDASIFTPSNDLEDRSEDPVWVSSYAASEKKLAGPIPRYPESAKRNHISGAVMLIATIGKDGHVIGTEVVGSPERSLSESAVESVRQWVYTPHLINGVAVKMRMTIAIHYNFAPA